VRVFDILGVLVYTADQGEVDHNCRAENRGYKSQYAAGLFDNMRGRSMGFCGASPG
jgi:hypothetical protein